MKVSYCAEGKDPKSPASPREGRLSPAALLQQQSCRGCGWAGGEKQCGRELQGRVLVSRESAEDEELSLQHANLQEKQDSLFAGNFIKLFSQNFLIFNRG